MKKITTSLVASALLVSSAYALETEAGTVSAEVSGYTLTQSEAKAGYTMVSGAVNFESKEHNGFKGSLGLMANIALMEETNNNDFDGAENVMLNVANVSYSAKDVTVVAGRQAIDLEWIGDYHTALVGVYTGVENATIIGGYTQSFNANGNDGALADFTDIGNDGAMVVDGTYKVKDNLTVGAYYMTAPDLFDGIGFKVESEVESVGITGKYAMTSNDNIAGNDGSIFSLDASYPMGDITVGGGYIMTEEKVGAGSLPALGDNINPLDSGNLVYAADSSTIYLSGATQVKMFDVNAIIGSSSGNASETEVNLGASWECKFVKGLDMSALLATVSSDIDANDETYFSLQAVYKFD